jgi:hypothetical protein
MRECEEKDEGIPAAQSTKTKGTHSLLAPFREGNRIFSDSIKKFLVLRGE